MGIVVNALKRHRVHRGATKAALARDSRVHADTITAIETYRTLTPHVDTVVRLAVALGVPPAQLVEEIEADAAAERGRRMGVVRGRRA